MRDLDKIEEGSNALGLSIKQSKCELYFTSTETDSVKTRFQSKLPEIELVNNETLTLLGAPIMEEAVGHVLEEKLNDLDRMGERLKQLDYHDALFLLGHCFAIPKLMYSLRTSAAFKNQEVLNLYDMKLREILKFLLNGQLEEEDAVTQCFLPVAMGGVGVRMASDLALPAFISSAHGAASGANSLLPNQLSSDVYRNLEEADSL